MALADRVVTEADGDRDATAEALATGRGKRRWRRHDLDGKDGAMTLADGDSDRRRWGQRRDREDARDGRGRRRWRRILGFGRGRRRHHVEETRWARAMQLRFESRRPVPSVFIRWG